MPYCMYLRKSRQDVEAEARGAGETLATHLAILADFAHSLGIYIAPDAIYKEIVSADTISERPVMQKLLHEVQTGKWDGVFCTEASRLSRGDSIDQGIVAQAFKFSRTKILTPTKIYDPDDDMDEEFFEFSLFFSRREYKSINRRLQAGRAASVRAGNYVGGKRPYGYDVIKRKGAKGYTLAQIPEEAAIVRHVFNWFLYDAAKPTDIAVRLNDMGVTNYSGAPWRRTGIYAMLRNPVYAGYVQWLKKESRTTIVDGERTTIRPRSSRYILTKGVHTPIITDQERDMVFATFEANATAPRVANARPLQNPLSGLLVCASCGYGMVRSISKSGTYYKCRTNGCTNHGTHTYIVIDAVLDTLRSWVAMYSAPAAQHTPAPSPADNTLSIARTALSNAEKQLDVARDMLERGVYTVDVFLQRQESLQRKIEQARAQVATLENAKPTRSTDDLIRANIPQIVHVLDAWPSCTTAKEQNALLRTVISSITLQKDTIARRNTDPRDALVLTIYPATDD